MSNREVDENGYITVKRNPISKVGVFPYLGKNISKQLDPNKIYWVLRPAEELGHPDTIESFKMVPIIEDHTMLGKGATPAEEKGVEGTTGQHIELDGDILYSDIRIFSDSMKEKLSSGKTELSMGYRVGEWEPANGSFNGQMYDFIQRKIRGNHIALVDSGRMGKEVAVLDHSCVYDHMEIAMDAADSNDNKTYHEARKKALEAQNKLEKLEQQLEKADAAKNKLRSSDPGYAQARTLADKLANDVDKAEKELSDAERLYKKAEEVHQKKKAKYENAEDAKETGFAVYTDKADGTHNVYKENGQYRLFATRGKANAKAAELKVKAKAGEKVGVEEMAAEKGGPKVYDTASDETASPTAENTGDAECNMKGNDMADEEKKGLSMDEVKEFIKGHAKDRKTFDKLMDSMRPAEDAEEGKAEDADEDKKAEDGDDDKKAEDADEEKAKKALDDKLDAEDDDDKKKDAQDAAIEGLRTELDSFKKNGMKTLMSEINKRNELGKEVEAAFGTFDHAEMTADEVAAYGLKKAGIKVEKGQEKAAWAGFNAGRKATRSVVATGQVFDHKEAPKGSLIEKTLNKSK